MTTIKFSTALGVTALVLAVAVGAVGLLAGSIHAQTTTVLTPTTTVPALTPTSAPPLPLQASVEPMPEVISVDQSGNALVRGTAQVNTGGANSLSLAGWGGTWTVVTTAATQVEPAGATAGDVSAIPAGDFIGVAGTVDPSQPWTIDASVVHDWTASPPTAVTAPMIPATTTTPATTSVTATTTTTLPAGDTLYTGTVSDVSNVDSGYFTLIDPSGATYTVNVAADATVWNTASVGIPLSNIKQGDSIRLDGSLQTNGSINADVVRDISQ